jgi:hypothetical protein
VLLLKLNEFTLNHLIPGLLLNFVLLKLLVVSYKKTSGLALIRLIQRLRSATNKYHAAIIKVKRSSHTSSVSSNITNPRKLWTTVNKILHRKISNSLPTCPDSTFLSNSVAYFFSSKIHKIHTNLLSDISRTSHIPCPHCNATVSDYDVWWKQDDILIGTPEVFKCEKCGESLTVEWDGEEGEYLVY